ncbi:MAG: L,D-transpeptidase [Rubricoccaceae bacterium]|nr:L,D-transpeptidase [Rubricoccaceae bacterium]
MFTKRLFLLFLVSGLAGSGSASAQSADEAADANISQDLAEAGSVSYFSQAWLIETMERRTGSLRDVPEVTYRYHVVPEGLNRLQARLDVYRRYGDRDIVKPLIWLLNRNDLEDLYPGDTLIVPSEFGLDFRAYSPFPRYYPAGREIAKIVILDKSIQAWAAYHNGELSRWGIISTGVQSNRTPSGRFNVNWKQDYRISTLSPGVINPAASNELWEMYWVMNLHEARGIHMHQYALPTSGPASHGCIRMLEPDAMWLFDWTDTWQKTGGTDISSVGGTIHEQGTMVLIIGHDINGPPSPFVYRERYPVLKMVHLPENPYSVSPGSNQQEIFDRRRRG